jgi:dihydrofolate synthase / folylpolyglutamate synthase
MQIQAIKTRPMLPPKDDLYQVLEESLPKIAEKSIVVVTSKIVAIHQGRCVPLTTGLDRESLATKEADWYLTKDVVPGQHIMFTRKNNVMIASGGIDKSNAKDHMVLWPNKPMTAAKEIYEWIKARDEVKELGVILTDSHVVMTRRGTQGISIGHWGINPVRDYRGRPDIFGRDLVVTVANVVDALASAAVVEMGEGQEQTPLAVITGFNDIEFSENEEVIVGNPNYSVPIEEDLFAPMLTTVPWKKGQGGLTDEELSDLQ